MSNNVLAFVLAGGNNKSLNLLEKRRAKAAIPFGGIYRLIDFTLSSLANSEINRVGVLTQYRPSSLIEHIYFGKPWDLKGRSREVRILSAFKSEEDSDWYKGTADAVYQNKNFISDYDAQYVIVLSGENIHRVNFDKVIDFHLKKKADVTIVTKYINDSNLSRFGIVEIDKDKRVTSFKQKPSKPNSKLVSLSMYLFNKKVLLKEIEKDSRNIHSTHSFTKNILPNILKKNKVHAYITDSPWYYIGSIDEYWRANMLMLKSKPLVNPESWGVRTNLEDRKLGDRPPAYVEKGALINHSIITRGCIVKGNVKNSILFPGVVVEKEAQVVDSIIMHDAYISKKAHIERSVFDKDVYVNENATTGAGKAYGFTVVGKSAVISKNVIIERDCLIYDGVKKEDFLSNRVKSGWSVFRK